MAAALDMDPTIGDRHNEVVRTALMSDLEAFTDRLARAVASGDPRDMATFADLVAVRYRKRRIPMNDVITLCNGVRRAAASVVDLDSTAAIDAAIDAGIEVFKWHGRLAGDAKKRHPLIAFIYKGA